MSLKAALSLSLGSARLLTGSLSRLGGIASQTSSFTTTGDAASSSHSHATQDNGFKFGNMNLQRYLKEQRTQDVFNQMKPHLPAQLLGSRKEEEQQQQQRPGASPQVVSALASAMRGGRSASPLLPPRSSRGPLSALGRRQTPAAAQVRHFNAWTASQRYFVEGDHVINAEVGRTLQFTGLDSGSFAPFITYTVVATAIASVFMILPLLIAPARVDLDKSSAYECGFDAFGEARQTFSVSFYLVSIMYLLFDIEIAYLFPYVMSHANATMFWTMNLFLLILVTGFVYEWGVGALEWRE